MKTLPLPLLALALALLACAPSPSMHNDSIEALLHSDPRLAAVVSEAPRFRLQARLGRIERMEDGTSTLTWTAFRENAEYFYPASTVKLLAAVAGLEAMNGHAGRTGLPLDERTPLTFGPQFEETEAVAADETNLENGRITLAHEIRKLFLVSDNEAYNRLYELVGQDGLARFATERGLPSAHLVHRLSERRSETENRLSPWIGLGGSSPDFLELLPERESPPLPAAPAMKGLEIGRGYIDGEATIESALDFAGKNRVSLADLSSVLVRLTRPELAPEEPSFDLTRSQRELLREAMTQLPRESESPHYDPAEYPDDWVKFLLPGIARVVPASEVRIANKIGRAYGFTTENAYVEHVPSGRAFFLAVTLYTNEDGILNDDVYEYEAVADPFLADLGETVARALFDG